MLHLGANGSVNALEAWRILGIYRLSDTVYKLRKDGWDVVTTDEIVTNHFGEKIRIGRYRLNPEQRISILTVAESKNTANISE